MGAICTEHFWMGSLDQIDMFRIFHSQFFITLPFLLLNWLTIKKIKNLGTSIVCIISSKTESIKYELNICRVYLYLFVCCLPVNGQINHGGLSELKPDLNVLPIGDVIAKGVIVKAVAGQVL